MNLDEAKIFLSGCVRWELRDHAFGDTEMGWEKDGMEVGGGYFGGGHASVWVRDDDADVEGSFKDVEAQELRNCGTLAQVGRNDETGPDAYSEGVTMPGLTKEGVRKELTNEPG